METKKTEQKGLIGNSKFGKHFYALTLGLAFVLSSGFCFFVSAGNLTVDSNLDNAYQTIGRVQITNDGTQSGTPYFDFNYDTFGGALFNNVNAGTVERYLGLDSSNHLVSTTNGVSNDDGDRTIDGNDIYRYTGNVSIGTNTYPGGKLNIISDEVKKPELYIQQTADSAANVMFKSYNNSFWTLGALNTTDMFYIGISGQTVSFYINSAGDAGINSNFNMNSNDIYGADEISAVAFVLSSDKNLKENIELIKDPLDKIYALNGYTFDWKKDGRSDVGLIAQEVQKVLPQIVHIDTNGHMGLEYANVVALLVEGIKELGNKLDGLYNKYLDQQIRINDLEQRLSKLEGK